MKKSLFLLLILLLLLLTGGFYFIPKFLKNSSNTSNNIVATNVKKESTEDSVNYSISDIKGYWQQTKRDWSGDITDMTADPYAYLEITDNKLYFYTESTMDKGYYETVAEKNYILEGDKLYYDYEDFKQTDWKENISAFGGIFTVSFNNEELVLTKYYGESKEEGYEIDTYIKMPDGYRLLEF